MPNTIDLAQDEHNEPFEIPGVGRVYERHANAFEIVYSNGSRLDEQKLTELGFSPIEADRVVVGHEGYIAETEIDREDLITTLGQAVLISY